MKPIVSIRNKRKYIFLTHSIVQVGGAEIYIRNKSNWLKGNGWDVDIFSHDKGTLYIQELKEYENCIFEELRFFPFAFSQKRRNAQLRKLCNIIKADQYQELIIESNNLNIALWAELLAKELQCKHILYTLQEDDKISCNGMYNFIYFKYQRNELVGISSSSVANLFSPYFEVPVRKRLSLRAFCTNVVEDIPSSLFPLAKADFQIGSIGRIEKPYLWTVIKGIKRLAELYPNLHFNITLIGGERHGNKVTNQIRQHLKKLNNVSITITGLIYPIPLELLRSIDVFLSSAGSAWITANLGIPTISYDAKDLKPIGVLNHTTNNALFRDKEKPIETEYLLSDILINKKYSKVNIPFKPTIFDFSSHLEFINNNPIPYSYYHFQGNEANKERITKTLLFSILGPKICKLISGSKNWIRFQKKKLL